MSMLSQEEKKAFQAYIAQRIAGLKELAKEKREVEQPAEVKLSNRIYNEDNEELPF